MPKPSNLEVPGAENIRKPAPTFIPIAKGEAGLTKPSIAVCHQIRVVDETRLGNLHGHVSPETLRPFPRRSRSCWTWRADG